MIEAMVTTIDNPHDPFDDYDSWYAYDFRVGHHTTNYLARMVVFSDEMSEADQALAIEDAVNRIVEQNVNGMYKKVTREVNET